MRAWTRLPYVVRLVVVVAPLMFTVADLLARLGAPGLVASLVAAGVAWLVTEPMAAREHARQQAERR